jgi:hypothetical protein
VAPPKSPKRKLIAKKRSAGTHPASALIRPTRTIPPKTSLFLYVQAGGRCEFDNCNKYLLEHGPTATPGNFAEQAHIWAFNEAGPLYRPVYGGCRSPLRLRAPGSVCL